MSWKERSLHPLHLPSFSLPLWNGHHLSSITPGKSGGLFVGRLLAHVQQILSAD